MERTTDYQGLLQTWSGRTLDLRNPQPEQICAADIAAGLSRVCRWNGQCSRFYSVAQHSIHVAALVSKENRLAALLHDAPEAYIGDLSRPLKQICPEFRLFEAKLWAVIAAKYGVDKELPADVKAADDVLLVTEARDLMPYYKDMRLPPNVAELKEPIEAWDPAGARGIWLAKFRRFTNHQFNE